MTATVIKTSDIISGRLKSSLSTPISKHDGDGTSKGDLMPSITVSQQDSLDNPNTADVFIDSNFHILSKEYNLRRSRSKTGSPRPGSASAKSQDNSVAAKRGRSEDTEVAEEEITAKKGRVGELDKEDKANKLTETVKDEICATEVINVVKGGEECNGRGGTQNEAMETASGTGKTQSDSKISPLKRKSSVSGGARSRKKQKVGAMKKTGSVERASVLCALCMRRESEHNLGFLFGPYKPQVQEEESKQATGTTEGTVSNGKSGEESKNDQSLWIHEDCAVWAPGVCLVGGKLLGLHDAVSGGQKLVCA